MDTRLKFVVAAGVAGVSTCGVAQAQSLSSFYVRGGALWPYSSTTKGDTSHYGPTLGIGYILAKGAGLQGSVEIDFSHLGGGSNIETYDLEYAERYSLGSKVYIGAGAGARVTHYGISSNATGGGSGGGGFTTHQTSVLGEALVGLQVTSSLSVELSAKFAPAYHTESTTGVSLLACFKF